MPILVNRSRAAPGCRLDLLPGRCRGVCAGAFPVVAPHDFCTTEANLLAILSVNVEDHSIAMGKIFSPLNFSVGLKLLPLNNLGGFSCMR